MKTLWLTGAFAALILAGSLAGWSIVTQEAPRPQSLGQSTDLTLDIGVVPASENSRQGAQEPEPRVMGGYAGTEDVRRSIGNTSGPAHDENEIIAANGLPLPANGQTPLQDHAIAQANSTRPQAANDALAAPADWKSKSGVWRWNLPAEPRHFSDMAGRLARANAYMESLQIMAALAGEWLGVYTEPDANGNTRFLGYSTRFDRDAEVMAKVLFEAFGQSKPGCARQHIIFHIANALPWEQARTWLIDLAGQHDAADREDALCALAFSGEEKWIDDFCALAANPARLNCYRDVGWGREHDDLCLRGEREYTRSYRCVELLDRGVYFTWHILGSGHRRFIWAHTKPESEEALLKRLLPAWIRRFEGHPGTDDMAYRLAAIALAENKRDEAMHWARVCSTTPDQDMTRSGTQLVLDLAEFVYPINELPLLLASSIDFARNRNLLHYIYVRRLASERGYEQALRELDWIARGEPLLLISRCYFARFAEPATKGVDSGLLPLNDDDSLKQMAGIRMADLPLKNPLCSWYGDEHQDLPACDSDQARPGFAVEAIQFPGRKLAAQFRAWESMAELLMRRDASVDSGRADLEYKLAAVQYHNRVLFPAYAVNASRSGLPKVGHRVYELMGDRAGAKQAELEWCRRAAPYLGAIEQFQYMLESYPNYAARDKVLFSLGLAQIKLSQFRIQHCTYTGERIREGVSAFEQCAREFPQSSLADDALSAARYWRRNYACYWDDFSVLDK